jgi:hypothetical protein
MKFKMLEDAVGPPKYFASRSKTLMLFWMLVDVTRTPKYADGRSKTLMLFWMLVDATGILKDVTSIMTLQEHDDALPSHGVKPTWGFHKVKLRKVETW